MSSRGASTSSAGWSHSGVSGLDPDGAGDLVASHLQGAHMKRDASIFHPVPS